ncbi:ISNCY family transposase, partial [Massilimicrobiota timonensis]|uniref:ISNCY family transposase n=2 Tax=Bacillota TaxID=1239 RepID=UPI001961E381
APATTIPLDIKNRIIKLYIDHYCDTNFTHFCEIIYDDFNVKISDTTLNKWLRDENIISPKARKKTRKILKDSLKAQLKMTRSKKSQNDIKEAISIIDSKNAHPRRPRCKYMGEMIQMDASSFEWIDGHIWHLHLAVDDATGEVVGAYFDTQETLNGYYNVFYQILTNYGIPAMFYTDRRTVFEYKKKNNAFDDDDTFTQFSYACHNLGVDIRTTSIAQAKGRIERMNQTFQSRLPVELRRAHITDIESANKFLKSYLKKFNDMFALHLNTTKSVFETQPSIEKINRTLAVLSPRKIDSGHSIRFQNRLYLPVTENGTSVYL